MNKRVIRIWIVLLAVLAGSACAKELPRVQPAEVGMSGEKLAKIDAAVQKLLGEKKLAGTIVVVARRGKIAFQKSYGQMDLEAKKPMRDDAIVRIYSMSKAITSVAALILHDEGKLKLDAPVSTYIPAFKGLEVYGKEGNVKPQREMTVRDLLRHTAGLAYGLSSRTPVDGMYQKAHVLDRHTSLEGMCAKLAKIPLAYQPGARWQYSISVDVLGRVVEVASGKPLDKFFAERLFKPLDMKDTAFFVPGSKLDRFAVNYTSDRQGKLTVRDAPAKSPYRKSPAHFSGGGGLVSTARDYMRFIVMIANGGELHGTRLLKAETVKLMTTNQLPEGVTWIGRRVGVGFGLGLSVRVKAHAREKSARAGECGWGGAASTHFWILPEEGLAVVTLEQTMPFSPLMEVTVKGLIYDALEK